MSAIILAVAAIVALILFSALAVRALGGNIRLMSDWKQAYKYYSSYGLLLLAELPTIWNAALSEGLIATDAVPGGYVWLTRAMAYGTFLLRQVNQMQRPANPFE